MKNQDKIPTNLGLMTETEIVSRLMYCSYKANRDNGMTHEQLVKIRVGTDKMNELYNKEKNEIKNKTN
jgi:hypothetical protein